MKKNIGVLFLTAAIMISVCGCGSRESESLDSAFNTETEQHWTDAAEGEPDEEEWQKAALNGEEEGQTEAPAGDAAEEEGFSFADLKNLDFSFCSGAGGWATLLSIDEDGSFSGQFYDADMGVVGEGYPNGTVSQSDFTGKFTQPVKVNEYTYSVQISGINYLKELGTEEIIDGVRYCYEEAYGLNGAEDILIYLPGAPLAELPEEFRSWVNYRDLTRTEDTELPFYALNNEAQQYGFLSYNIIENVKRNISVMADNADFLEESIRTESFTQTEYNEKTKELYDIWDYALNMLWGVLKRTLDTETMDSLTAEECDWIARKEQEAAAAGAEFEGGSIQPMIVNQKAAEMTKDRVYELLELLE